MGSVLSLQGAFRPRLEHLYRNARTIQEVEALALARDWRAVFFHYGSALGQIEQEAELAFNHRREMVEQEVQKLMEDAELPMEQAKGRIA